MKRTALYIRVSTLDQHPETQQLELRSLAQQRGLEVVHEYVDHGFSGARIKRPALDELLADARRRRFDLVLVWACDRLARSTKHFLEVLDEFSHLGSSLSACGRTSILPDHSVAPLSPSSARSLN